MKASELVDHIKQALDQAKQQGNESVLIENLLRFLDDFPIADEMTAAELEHYKANLALHADHARLTHESSLEMFRSVIAAGQSAIRALFTLNGGAAIAMLAFIGHLATESPKQVEPFAPTLLPFAIGVFLASGLAGVTYLSQWLYATERTVRWGFALNIVAMGTGFASLIAFGLGMYWVYEAFNLFNVVADAQLACPEAAAPAVDLPSAHTSADDVQSN